MLARGRSNGECRGHAGTPTPRAIAGQRIQRERSAHVPRANDENVHACHEYCSTSTSRVFRGLPGAATAHQGTRSARGVLRVRLLLRAPRAHDEDATLPRRASSIASASDVTSASPPPVPLRENKTSALLPSALPPTRRPYTTHRGHGTRVHAYMHTDVCTTGQRAGTHAHTDRLPPTDKEPSARRRRPRASQLCRG